MGKRLITFMFFVFLNIFFISALQITEVELNPSEGNEWVEIYNNEGEDLNISGWEIWEGVYGSQGPKLITKLNYTVPKDSFYIIDWEGFKLNNDGDYVILYDGSGNKIDETPKFEDNQKDDSTWQLCDGEWLFQEETKGDACVEAKDEESSGEEPLNETSDEAEALEELGTDVEKETIEISVVSEEEKETEEKQKELKVIKLNFENSKDIKTNTNTELSEKNLKSPESYSLYVFLAFCVLIIGLFTAKKLGKRKNEFG